MRLVPKNALVFMILVLFIPFAMLFSRDTWTSGDATSHVGHKHGLSNRTQVRSIRATNVVVHGLLIASNNVFFIKLISKLLGRYIYYFELDISHCLIIVD